MAIFSSSAENYSTVDHLEPIDADLPSCSTVFQPSQDSQGWDDDNQDEKRDHCVPFIRSRSAAAAGKIDLWPGALCPHSSWTWPATAGPSNLSRISASATADSARSQIWGHASGIPGLSRPIQNSGWSCFRYRSLASFNTRRTACTARFCSLPAPRDLRRSALPSMRARELADRLVRPDRAFSTRPRTEHQRHGPDPAKCYDCYSAKEGR